MPEVGLDQQKSQAQTLQTGFSYQRIEKKSVRWNRDISNTFLARWGYDLLETQFSLPEHAVNEAQLPSSKSCLCVSPVHMFIYILLA